MRNLLEIVEDAKEGKMPTHEECYWAMLALSYLQWFESHDLRQVTVGRDDIKAKMVGDEAFRRRKIAFGKSPKEWVGWSNDPANPEYQRLRKTAFKVLRDATGEDLNKPEKTV